MKTIYFRIISIVVIYALLCPQALRAENLPDASKEPAKQDLVSFEEYDSAKALEKELLEEKTSIQTAPEDLDFKFKEDEEGNLEDVKIKGEDLTITVTSDDVSTIEEKKSQIEYLRYEISEIQRKWDPDTEFFKAEIAVREKQIRQLESEIEEYASGNNQSTIILAIRPLLAESRDAIMNKSLNEGAKDKPEIPKSTYAASRINNGTPINDKDSDSAKTIANREHPAYIKIDTDSAQLNAIKGECSALSKAYIDASAKFNVAASPYYETLASDLRKAHWLWQRQNIDPHIYYAGADNILDGKEIKRMVEDGIAYLYKNVPGDVMQQAERNEILGIERDLRAKYVGPALDVYNKELKQASVEFYRAVKNAVKPFINPFVNKTDTGIEVIISLPKATLK